MTSEGTPPRLAVTGAGGFVGSRLVSALPDGAVRSLVRTRVDYLPSDGQVEVDMLADPDTLTRAFAGARAVVHLAGHNEVVARQEPDRALAETALGARHVAEAARAAGVERVVYVSTVHVYGPPADGEVLTEDRAPAPRSTYAIARLTCEHLLAQADLDLVVLRLSNALGPPADPTVDRWTLVASDLCRQATLTGSMALHSAGLQWRDFVDLGDVCRVIGASTDPDRVAAGVYNLASGRSRTIRSIAELVQDTFERLTGTRPELRAPDPDGPAPPATQVSIERLAAQGQRPATPVAASIEELARFCLEHEDHL